MSRKVEQLPSGSYRIRIYAGKNPETGKYEIRSFIGKTREEAEAKAEDYEMTRMSSDGKTDEQQLAAVKEGLAPSRSVWDALTELNISLADLLSASTGLAIGTEPKASKPSVKKAEPAPVSKPKPMPESKQRIGGQRKGKCSKRSLSVLMDEYIVMSKPTLSPSTIRGYRKVQRQLEAKHSDFMGRNIQCIASKEVQALVNAMIEDGSAPKTIRNCTGLISAVFNFNGLAMPQHKIPRRENKPPKIVLKDKDVNLLLDVAKGSEMEIPILLGAFCGMRRSEVFALRAEDISSDNVAHIWRTCVQDEDKQYITRNATKTKLSCRDIPIPSEVANRIREKGCVTNLSTPHALTCGFERIAEKCGLKGARFHDLRHFFASYLHAQHLPDAAIQRLGGWSTDSTMKSIYRHDLQEETNKIMSVINAEFDRRIRRDTEEAVIVPIA